MSNRSLPDVSVRSESTDWGPALSWVGMSAIALPVKVSVGQGQTLSLVASLDFQVNLLDRRSRGIHMSRLYRLLTEGLAERELSFEALGELCTAALASHPDQSSRARIAVQLDWPILRQSLVSNLKGWRSYPVRMFVTASKESGEAGPAVSREIEIEVLYSSTCPASTALSLSHQGGGADAADWRGFRATPHAQRSRARVKVRLGKDKVIAAKALIDATEAALMTVVQTTVKREDELHFAILNAENPMFCEDAARRICKALDPFSFESYEGDVRHFESLHPHDAVAFFASGDGDGP